MFAPKEIEEFELDIPKRSRLAVLPTFGWNQNRVNDFSQFLTYISNNNNKK